MPCNFKSRKSKLIEYDNPYIYSKCCSFKTFSFKLLLSSRRAFILSMILNQRNHLSSSYSRSLSFVLTVLSHPGVSE